MKKIVVLFVLLCSVITNCASFLTYPPPRLPETSIAILILDDSQYVTSVDGKGSKEWGWSRNPGKQYIFGEKHKIELLPGNHDIASFIHWDLGPSILQSSFSIPISFYAEAGQKYLLSAKVDEDMKSWHPFIKNLTTGNIVAE